MMTTNGTKYTFVCDPDECDTLIEVTCVSGFGFPNGVIKHTCPCGREMSYISATILSSNQTTKEEKMETNTPINYDANVLVTYKDIVDGNVTYPTIKVNDLEWRLERIKNLENQLSISNKQIGTIIENLSEDGYFNPNYEKEDLLNDLCEILGHEPKKEVQFEGTIYFSGRIDVPLAEYEDFDLEDYLSEITVDCYNGDVVIDEYHTEDVKEA